MNIDTKSLHPLEVRVLVGTDPSSDISASILEEQLSLKLGQCNQALSWLSAKELIAETDRTAETVYEITDLGQEYRKSGTPGERIIQLIAHEGPKRLPEIAQALGLENRDVGSAFGALSKEGVLGMDSEKRASLVGEASSATLETLKKLLERAATDQLAASELTDEELAVVDANAKKRGAESTAFQSVTN